MAKSNRIALWLYQLFPKRFENEEEEERHQERFDSELHDLRDKYNLNSVAPRALGDAEDDLPEEYVRECRELFARYFPPKPAINLGTFGDQIRDYMSTLWFMKTGQWGEADRRNIVHHLDYFADVVAKLHWPSAPIPPLPEQMTPHSAWNYLQLVLNQCASVQPSQAATQPSSSTKVGEEDAYLYTLGPGLKVNRGGASAEISGNEFAILGLLKETGRANVEDAMSRSGKSAVWREKYDTTKRDKIQTALRRLNVTLSDNGLYFSVELSRDELVIKSDPMPRSE